MKKLLDAVDKNKRLILDAERFVWKNPETGYKEFKTSKYMAEQFIKLGYDLTYADGITGFYTVLDTGRKGPRILILGELDSIICPNHPESDPETGAVHSCGHNAQCAALLGVAAALKEDGVLDDLCGQIMLCAVPAEELLEIEFRSKLKEQGIIKYFGGKPEFLSRGYFDCVDIAMMIHTTTNDVPVVSPGSIGCIAKRVIYKGKAAHAGGSPWDGNNALYAATCGINACNALRETFKEKDIIRFHPIVTKGGSMVNAIPETVEMESFVRGKTFDAIAQNNKRLNQALIGAALSLGNNVEIIDSPGYAPHQNAPDMIDLCKDAFTLAFPNAPLKENKFFSSGSTDMGDLSCVMPVIHPYACGAKGTSHGNDYYIDDPEKACVDSAKWQVAMLFELLKDNAQRANKIIENYKPQFNSKDDYFAYCDSLSKKGDRIEYKDDQVQIRL